ncbi:uncharacterized protein LOC116341464 [Contarinia nasturtii]|uniref:uncharacterized protein LOC116341464 n=1 Tax=Contarinia nasturtii TaxID=265458 RepID=UPI0012D4B646|nr:uncharacterized protein LOC116341464 [Contarinia nasturtii]
MKFLIFSFVSLAILATAYGGSSVSVDRNAHFEVMESVWDDIVKEDYFDMDLAIDLYDYKETPFCPTDFGNDIEEIVGKIQQISLALNEINVDVRREADFVRPILRSLSNGAMTATTSVQKCVTSAKKLYDAYQKYRSSVSNCYNGCKANMKSIAVEVNQLLGGLVDVINKGLKMGKPIDSETIQHKKPDIQQLLQKIDNFHDFMDSVLTCSQKTITTYLTVQSEFNSLLSNVKSFK